MVSPELPCPRNCRHGHRSRFVRSLPCHRGAATAGRSRGRHIARQAVHGVPLGPEGRNNPVAWVRGCPVAGPASLWVAESRPGDRPGDWSDPSAAWSRSVGRRDRLGVAAFDPRVVRLPAPTRRCGARHRGGDSSNIRPAGGTRDSRVASARLRRISTTSRLEFSTGSINSGEEPLGQQICTSWPFITNLVYRDGRDLGRGGFPFIHYRQTCTDGIGEALLMKRAISNQGRQLR